MKARSYVKVIVGLLLVATLLAFSGKKSFAADCSTTTITLTQSSSNIFYVDSGISPALDSNYVSYKIQTGASNSFSDLWVTAGTFSDTTKLKLATNEDGRYHVGALSANSTVYVYFYLQGAATASSQTYTLSLYDGHPLYGGTTTCTKSVSNASVNETIKASPNKVTSVVSSPAYIGGNLTMTVTGDTGVMGGSGIFAYTPASANTWPADCYELHETQITLTGGNTGSYTSGLILSGLNSPTSSYTIVYTFVAKCTTAGNTTVTPVNYINSGGTNIKHTDTGTATYTSIPPISPASNALTLVKTVSPASASGASTPTYTLTFTNSGSTAVTVDVIRDTLPSSPATVSYSSGTSTFNGGAISNPSISGQVLSWSGSFSIPGTSSRALQFQASVPSTVGTYTNSAIGLIESTQIDTTTLTSDNLPATVNFSVGTPNLSTSTKSVSDLNGGNVQPGDTLRYTVTVINTGTATGSGVSVIDTIDTDTQSLTNVQTTNCGSPTNSSTSTQLNVTGNTVTTSTNCVITFDVSVKTPLNEGTSVTNTATVSAATEGGSGATPSSPAKTVDATPALVVTKSEDDADNTVLRNQVVTYTITIQNTGDGQATGISLTDAIDSDASASTGSLQYTNCGSPSSTSTSSNIQVGTISISAGATCSISFTAAVSGSAVNTATIPNSVDASAATEGGNNPSPVSASTLTVSVPSVPDLSGSSKSVSDLNAGTVQPGDTLRYTINVLNGGGQDASGVSVTDTIDTDTQNLTNVVTGAAATNCGSPSNSSTSTQLNITTVSVTAGTTCKITFDVTVKSPLDEGTAISNSATIGAALEGGSGGSPSSTTVFVNATPALVVTNSENDADNIVTQNQVVTYTVTIQNTGDGQATGVSASGSIDSDAALNTGSFGFTNCGSPNSTSTSSSLALDTVSIASGATCTITYTVTVSGSALDAATIPNSVDVSAATEGGNNPSAAGATTLTVSVPSAPNLSTSTKTVTDLNGGGVEPGDSLRYTITIANSGGVGASGVSATDTIDTDTQSLTSVVIGASATNCGGSYTNNSTSTQLNITGLAITSASTCKLTFDVSVKSPLNEGTAISNTATISAATEGGSGASPSSTTLFVDATPALAVVKTEDDADNTVLANQVIGYTITIQNTGNGQASGISLADTMAADVTMDTGSINYTSCGSPHSTSASSHLTLDSITVNAGTTCTITYNVSVNGSANDGDTITNAVDVSAASEGGNDPSAALASTLTVLVLSSPTNLHFQDDATNLGCSATSNLNAHRVAWDSVSSAVSYTISLDSGSPLSTGATTYYDWTIPAIDGIHTFEVQALDALSNATAWSGTCQITLDQTAPAVDAGTDKTATTAFTQSSSSASDSGSGITSYAWTKVTGPGTITFNDAAILHPDVSASVDGTYVIRLTVTDNAVNSASDTFTLVWDSTTPSVNAGIDQHKKVSFTQDATVSDSGSGIASILWQKVSGPGIATFTTNNIEDPTVSADTDGTYVLRVTVTDTAGNSANDTFTLVWDTTPPIVTIDTNPSLLTNNTGASFTFSATDNITLVGNLVYECKLDSGSFVSCTSPYSSSVAEGTHTLTVHATDEAGNTGTTDYTWVVDTTPPVITLLGSSTITLNVGDPYSDGGATALDNVDGNDTGAIVVVNSVTTAAPGTYTVTYNVTDAAGNVAITVTRTIIVNDADGTDFIVEQAAPNSGDANDDGLDDGAQKDVTSLVNPVTNNYEVLANESNCQNTNVNQVRETALADKDSNYLYPAGLMNFTLICGTPGMTADVVQYYYGLSAANIIARKYDSITHSYRTINGAAVTNVVIGGKQAIKITYQITDGSSLDADGLANGTIIDPSGPAVLSTSITAPNTGLWRQTAIIPTVLVLTGLLTMAGALYVRRKSGTKSS